MGEEVKHTWADYDAGLLNGFGGGNVDWWQDYLRAEIGRANDFWREQVEGADASSQAEIARLKEALDRQTDNMAFILNRVDLYAWNAKFERELADDRRLLSETRSDG